MTVREGYLWLRQHALILILGILIGTGIAAAYTASQPRLYTANTSAYVLAGDNKMLAEAQAGDALATNKASAYLPLMRSLIVADDVVDELGLTDSPQAVASAVTATVSPGSPHIQVSVTMDSPTKARDVADAVVVAAGQQASELEGGSTEHQVVRMVPISPAMLPTSPSAPNWRKNLASGMAGGLLLGLGLAYLRGQLDTRIRRPEDIAEVTSVGVIGTLPQVKGLDRASHAKTMDGPYGEAIRHVRTNLTYADLDEPPTSVAVTSARPGEGKSSVATMLARSIATRGEPVVLIDADLRRPRIADLFDIDGSVGLTQVLAGAVALDDAAVEIENDVLWVLPAGRLPHNPSEVLGSERMAALIEELTRTRFVIVDAPPLLPVTDALLLSKRVSGVLIVTRVQRSRKEWLERALGLLEGLRARVYGIVLNRVPQGRSAEMYGYERYGYATTRGGRADQSGTPKRRSRAGKRGR